MRKKWMNWKKYRKWEEKCRENREKVYQRKKNAKKIAKNR